MVEFMTVKTLPTRNKLPQTKTETLSDPDSFLIRFMVDSTSDTIDTLVDFDSSLSHALDNCF